MAQEIRHDGIVDSVDGQTVVVRINQSSACGGCQVRNICRAAESKDKLVEINCPDAGSLRIGQTVTVTGAESLGMKAVIYSFGLPLLLLLVALITAEAVTGSEKMAALAALGILLPYYIVLFLLRDRIKKDFQFSIKH